MTEQLRHALQRLGDDTPDLATPPDLWSRGRRARRRDRLVTATAVVALLAVLGGFAWAIRPLGLEAAPAGSPGPDRTALPRQVWAVPDHLVEFREDGGYHWAYGVGERDLAIGPAVLAFETGGGSRHGLSVVVTRDGAYHPLDLPGYVGIELGGGAALADLGQTVALSPDGTRLAWVYGAAATGREDYSPVPSGIRLADLTSGDVTEVPLEGLLTEGQALVPQLLTWSPDSRWLGWQGQEYRQYNASGTGSGGLERQAGRIDVRSGRSTPLPRAGDRDLLAVADDGTMLFRQRGRLGAWGPTSAGSRDDIEEADLAAAVSPDGSRLALSRAMPGDVASFATVATGAVRGRALSRDVYSDDVMLRALGWSGDDVVLTAVTTEGDQVQGTGSHLALMTAPGSAGGSSYRITTRLDPGVDAGTVSVAYAAIDPADPAADLPEPSWPWSIQRTVSAWVLGALALLLGVGLAVRSRRRQDRRVGPA